MFMVEKGLIDINKKGILLFTRVKRIEQKGFHH